MIRNGGAVLMLMLATALPASAQIDVARRSFIFLDNNLTIQVVSDNAGALRVLRGEAGLVEVAARAPGGVPAFALGGRQGDELQLTAVGAADADFVVIVPQDVRVRVRLPSSQLVETAARPYATYKWIKETDQDVRKPAEPSPERAPAAPSSATSGMFLSHYSRAVPVSFSVPDANNLGRLEVRFDGADFRLSTNRAVSVNPGRSDTIELRAVNPGLDAVISLPTDTRDFKLVLNGKLALQVNGGELGVYCDQLQRASGSPRVYSFSPTGEMTCR